MRAAFNLAVSLARLTLTARLALLGLVGLLALWLIGLGVFFLGHDEFVPKRLMAQERVAAMIAALEPAPPETRALILRALSGPSLTARLQAAAPDEPPFPALAPLVADYRAALDGRPVMFLHPRRPPGLGPLARFIWGYPDEFDLVARLRDGQSLVLAARPPQSLSPLGLPTGLAGGLVSALVALMVLIGVIHETRPLRELAAALDKVDLDGGVAGPASPRGGAPEIRSLAAAFARMQARLAALLHARLALIGGISHDLRTFATRLRLRIEAIGDEDERAAAIQDIADMIRLMDDSLLATQGHAGKLREELLDLSPIVAEEAEARRRAGAPVSALRVEAAQVIGDPLALRRIIANLVDNALKYGGRADIALDVRAHLAFVIVEDLGPGIPVAMRAAVLEPFERLEPSRSRDRGGAGLGLAIARNLARAQGGDVAIGDRQGGGARVVLSLPLFET